MKTICISGNTECEYYIHEKEFDVEEENFDISKCPECGGKIAPAWIKEFELPKEKKLKNRIADLREKRKNIEREISELKNRE